jgi:hypothetical protein
MNRFLFAGALGVLFSVLVMLVVPQPYALLISAFGSLAVGWFSSDVYNVLFKNRA